LLLEMKHLKHDCLSFFNLNPVVSLMMDLA
jgi:hypothetical protein